VVPTVVATLGVLMVITSPLDSWYLVTFAAAELTPTARMRAAAAATPAIFESNFDMVGLLCDWVVFDYAVIVPRSHGAR
jgi:hypothetical protein